MTERVKNQNESFIMVSVIVLTYNHKAYISQALDSILMQDVNFPIEILVGDDGSTDGTSEIIREYAYKYPNILFPFFREHNMGATKNLRDLLEKAKGKYISSCEGDDYWTDSSKLKKQFFYMETHPEYIGCVHSFTVVDEKGIPLKKQKLRWISKKKIYTLKDFKGLFLPGHPVTFFYKNIFYENKSACEVIEKAHPQIGDRTIAMLLAAQGNIFQIDENMACYRRPLKNRNNLTIKLGEKSDNKLIEYRMNDFLEAYAQNVLGKKVNFDWFRRDLLFRTIIKCMIKPSQENFACLIGILQEWKRRYYSKKNSTKIN